MSVTLGNLRVKSLFAQQALCNAGFVCCDILLVFLVNVTNTKSSIFSVENYGIVFCVMKLEKELMLLKLLETYRKTKHC